MAAGVTAFAFGFETCALASAAAGWGTARAATAGLGNSEELATALPAAGELDTKPLPTAEFGPGVLATGMLRTGLLRAGWLRTGLLRTVEGGATGVTVGDATIVVGFSGLELESSLLDGGEAGAGVTASRAGVGREVFATDAGPFSSEFTGRATIASVRGFSCDGDVATIGNDSSRNFLVVAGSGSSRDLSVLEGPASPRNATAGDSPAAGSMAIAEWDGATPGRIGTATGSAGGTRTGLTDALATVAAGWSSRSLRATVLAVCPGSPSRDATGGAAAKTGIAGTGIAGTGVADFAIWGEPSSRSCRLAFGSSRSCRFVEGSTRGGVAAMDGVAGRRAGTCGVEPAWLPVVLLGAMLAVLLGTPLGDPLMFATTFPDEGTPATRASGSVRSRIFRVAGAESRIVRAMAVGRVDAATRGVGIASGCSRVSLMLRAAEFRRGLGPESVALVPDSAAAGTGVAATGRTAISCGLLPRFAAESPSALRSPSERETPV